MFDSFAELFFHTYPNTLTYFILKLTLWNELMNYLYGYKNFNFIKTKRKFPTELTKEIQHLNKNMGIKVSQLAKISTLFPDLWRSLNE